MFGMQRKKNNPPPVPQHWNDVRRLEIGAGASSCSHGLTQDGVWHHALGPCLSPCTRRVFSLPKVKYSHLLCLDLPCPRQFNCFTDTLLYNLDFLRGKQPLRSWMAGVALRCLSSLPGKRYSREMWGLLEKIDIVGSVIRQSKSICRAARKGHNV